MSVGQRGNWLVASLAQEGRRFGTAACPKNWEQGFLPRWFSCVTGLERLRWICLNERTSTTKEKESTTLCANHDEME